MAVKPLRFQFGSRHNFQLGGLYNSGLFSSHWLENRLPLEPEWNELKEEAKAALKRLVDLWHVQKNRVELYEDEQGLEEAFIQPVLEALGWKFKYQPFLQPRIPDYALFLDDATYDAALKAGRKSPDFWKYPVALADAKAWHISLDRPSIVNGKKEYPPEQIEWYLNRSQLDFGILTNGKLWRLIPREYEIYHRRFEAYLQVDLPAIVEGWIAGASDFVKAEWHLEEFLPFYLFFGPRGFRTTGGRKPLIRRAAEGSSEYRLGIGEDLRTRAFEALRLCISGFLHYPPNGLDPGHLELCRGQSFILLYRLLFIMFAEDRGLLPYRMNELYTRNRSLARHRDEIAGKLDRVGEGGEADYSKNETTIWDDLQDLFDLVDRGHARYGVPAYNGGLFDAEQYPFLSQKKVPDHYMAHVIDHLGRAKDPEIPALGLSRVDYRDLAIQHLGGVYEGLLEQHPRYAPERMIVIRERSGDRPLEKTIPASQQIPSGFEYADESYEPGAIYLQNKKGDRRATGSYYTPDHIVTHIVNETLAPLCKGISEKLDEDIARATKEIDSAEPERRGELLARVELLKREFDDRVLGLRVLDPAMGSGHFLIRACQYLGEEIATHPYAADNAIDEAATDESSVAFWKRRVVESCLYGVDLNPLAVELAKLALWLETVAVGRPLTFLDHHIRPGNSLVGGKIGKMGVLPGEILLRANALGTQLEEKLPLLLKPLQQIRTGLSERVEDVKSKEKLYRAFEKAREPFRDTADLWCSTFVKDDEAPLTDVEYQQALDNLGQPKRFAQLATENWFVTAKRRVAREDIKAFHWELEFPEAFFGDAGRRLDVGFDAIIGNPPYDVLSERESGQDLSALRAFIEYDEVYAPSQRGKNNLYKLFICRALELLADGGHFGFITPMPLLGDDQAAGIRRAMIEIGSFAGIEAFPQKDNPANRVFPEAKLSTTVFTFVKGKGGQQELGRCRSRIHPGRFILRDSPGMVFSTGDIPAYDPDNFTIVSCSQADWDIAARIMKSGRMTRLKSFCTSYQGEVNETTDSKRGGLSDDHEAGPLILRGANICLYAVRQASQGKSIYLAEEEFLKRRSPGSKAFHSKNRRVGFQRSSPQNNFRRVIAAIIGPGNYCFDTVSYVPESECKLSLAFVLALLNSKLLDWYFRLGSTNSKVNEYQFNNLPCPTFSNTTPKKPNKVKEQATDAIRAGELSAALKALSPMLAAPPFPCAIQDVVVEAVNQIITIEEARENVARRDRSALHPQAQPYQDFIDRVLYAMAGLSAEEAAGLEERLSRML